MSAESDYIRAERDNILRTIDMIEDLTTQEELTTYETIALGKLLQDVYSGIERILRSKLETHDLRIPKTESWHKEVLLAAQQKSIVSQDQFDALRKLLLFRHMQIHGYGYMLDEQRLRELAGPVPKVCRDFLSKIA
ncbi:MAG: hypothetical protein JSW66_10520 [Phycisphaerales bacterium]|nr:MAG: hypothetical protein JSW66_10520 [Phycisphaerales bacterium]